MSSQSLPRRIHVEDTGRTTDFFIPDEPVIVGRGDTCDLILADTQISKRHCELRIDDDEVVLRDLGSTNGTFVNGNRVHHCSLRAGDVVTLGECRLELLGDVETAPASPVRPIPQRAPTPRQAVAATAEPSSASTRVPAQSRSRSHSSSSARSLAFGVILVALGAGGFFYWQKTQRPITRETPEHLVSETPTDAPTSAPTPTPTPAPVDDAARALDAALTREDWILAASLIEKQGRPPAAVARLSDRLHGTQINSIARFKEIRRTDGADAAKTWLRGVVETIPAGWTVREALDAIVRADHLPGDPGSDPAVEYTAVSRKTAPKKPDPTQAPEPSTAVAGAKSDPGTKPDPTEKSPQATAAARELAQSLTEAAQALDQTDLATGLAGIQKVAAAAKVAGVKSIELGAARMIRIAEAEGRFRAGVVRRAGAGFPMGRDLPHLPGEHGKLIAATADGLTLGGQQGQVTLRWKVVPAHTLVALLPMLDLEGTELVDAAAALYRRDRAVEADALLTKAESAGTPEMTSSINQTLADARGMLTVPKDGFHRVDDQWLSPQEWARHVAAATVERSTKALQSPDAATRRAAFDEMLKLGDAAKAPLHRSLLLRRASLMEELQKKSPIYAKLVELATERARLDDLRAAVLKIIDDPVKYPYPYRPPEATPEQFAAYAAAQKEIDGMIPEVKKAWESKTVVHIPPQFRQKIAELDEVAKWLAELAVAPVDPGPQWLTSLPATEEVTLKTIATSIDDRTRIDQSAKIMADNVSDPGGSSKGEQDEAKITNDYRVMLGRWALRVYAPLVRAARGHTEDMSRLGFFAHESPVEGKKTPWERMKREGMDPVGASENIAQAGGPSGAHSGWCHSSGHHRNLLSPEWRIFGVGNTGGLWCQNFAVADGKKKEAEKAETR